MGLLRAANDVHLAGRDVSALRESSAISGEYLSAAYFMGIAGMVMKFGYDALWYAVGLTAGYVFLVLFIAGPIRRFGAHTVAGFAESRFDSRVMRATAATFALVLALLHMLPQMKAAGITLAHVLGSPYWVGVVVAGIGIALGVLLGGMKDVTLAQGVLYWVKLFAIAVPIFVLTAVTGSRGALGTAPGPEWLEPFGALASGYGEDHALLYTYSLVIALVCGTAGLPRILARYCAVPDGRQAKRTGLVAIGLLSLFFVFPAAWGAMGRTFIPSLSASGAADLVTIRLPEAVMGSLGQPLLGSVLSGITAAGAFAAFVTAVRVLLLEMSGAFAHDVLGHVLRPDAGPEARLLTFRTAAGLGAALATGLGLLVERFDIMILVGWAFAIGASTLFPLLLLGAWYRGLTQAGAIAGMVGGGTAAVGSVLFSVLVDAGIAAAPAPLLGALTSQPAIWTVPLALVLMLIVSRATPSLVPADARLKMLRLHAPEHLGLRGD